MLGENSRECSIGELAARLGVRPSAIRYYEARGLVRPERTSGGQRRYDDDAELALRQLMFAQSAGFTLSEIAALLGPMQSGEPLFAGWALLAQRKLIELDRVIEQALEMKERLTQALECRCPSPRDCGLLNDSAG